MDQLFKKREREAPCSAPVTTQRSVCGASSSDRGGTAGHIAGCERPVILGYTHVVRGAVHCFNGILLGAYSPFCACIIHLEGRQTVRGSCLVLFASSPLSLGDVSTCFPVWFSCDFLPAGWHHCFSLVACASSRACLPLRKVDNVRSLWCSFAYIPVFLRRTHQLKLPLPL